MTMIRALLVVFLCTALLKALPRGEPGVKALALAISDFLAAYLDQPGLPKTRIIGRDFADMSAEIRKRARR